MGNSVTLFNNQTVDGSSLPTLVPIVDAALDFQVAGGLGGGTVTLQQLLRDGITYVPVKDIYGNVISVVNINTVIPFELPYNTTVLANLNGSTSPSLSVYIVRRGHKRS